MRRKYISREEKGLERGEVRLNRKVALEITNMKKEMAYGGSE